MSGQTMGPSENFPSGFPEVNADPITQNITGMDNADYTQVDGPSWITDPGFNVSDVAGDSGQITQPDDVVVMASAESWPSVSPGADTPATTAAGMDRPIGEDY